MKTNISKTTSIWIFLMKSRFKNNVFYKFLSVFPNMDERSFYFGKRQSIRVIKISPRLIIFFFKVTKPIHRKLVRTKSILCHTSVSNLLLHIYINGKKERKIAFTLPESDSGNLSLECVTLYIF